MHICYLRIFLTCLSHVLIWNFESILLEEKRGIAVRMVLLYYTPSVPISIPNYKMFIFSTCITFTMYLDILYISVHKKNFVSTKIKMSYSYNGVSIIDVHLANQEKQGTK
jgi:hypothetical protein